jgi:hypothetical protein
VLTFEPYKSFLLLHWRFRTVAVARESAGGTCGSGFRTRSTSRTNFIGMDMARKSI